MVEFQKEDTENDVPKIKNKASDHFAFPTEISGHQEKKKKKINAFLVDIIAFCSC